MQKRAKNQVFGHLIKFKWFDMADMADILINQGDTQVLWAMFMLERVINYA